MNYFRCTVGGSGKGNTVTVTCAEEFAGLTITLAKTGKTYTKTCPSTAPYVVTFYGVENGTYTVSGTVDGETYSETVIVQDISCVLNYGFKWQTWVDTASQLDSSDYDSLDEVLADEKALRELFLEHACVDYMASVGASNEDLETIINNDLCAKWINLSDYALDFLGANTVIKALMDEADKYGYGEWALMPQVPKMTSNTAPFGEASINGSPDTSGEAYRAFDGNESTTASLATASTTGHVQYKFVNPISIKQFMFLTKSLSTDVSLQVSYSDDGSTFTDISESFTYGTSDSDKKVIYTFSNDYGAHLYWRITRTRSTTAKVIANLVQFYAWAPKGNVPVMTSNTAPFGNVLANSRNSNRPEWYSFRRISGDGWASANNVTTTGYIGYQFVNPVKVKRFLLQNPISTVTAAPKTFQLRYSDDGTNWTVVQSYTSTDNTAHKYNYYDVTEDVGYHRMWTVLITSIWNSSASVFTFVGELQFYGRELKVSVPTMTSNTAPYGVASANSENTSADYKLWKAFDGNANTQWLVGSAVGTSHTNLWIRYKFTTPMVARFAYVLFSSNINSQSYMIQGSNDATTWATLANGNKTGSDYIYINNDTPYLYYQLFISTQTLSQSLSGGRVTTLQFYGLDYSEKEFEVGTTKKWLYDHGVELEQIDLSLESATYGEVAKEPSQIYVKAGSTSITAATQKQTAAITHNKIDLTNYSLIKVSCGDKLSKGNSSGTRFMLIQAMSSNPAASAEASKSVTTIEFPCYLDISNINSQQYILIGENNNLSYCTFNELWLE